MYTSDDKDKSFFSVIRMIFNPKNGIIKNIP